MTKKSQEFNWLTNNILPIIFALLSWAATFGILSTKVDIVIQNQKDQSSDFKDWKRQYEQRLGQAELNIVVLHNRK